MQLPEPFTTYTRQLMGDELFNTFMDGLRQEPPVSIRLNPLKSIEGGENLKPQTFNLKSQTSPIPWCELGYYLDERPSFTFDPLFHAGTYYVQEASSMFLYHVLQQLSNLKLQTSNVLDLCAAPGGKSTILRTLLPEESTLYCNEPVRQRVHILSENMQKFGHPNVIVTNNYPRDYRESGIKFDLILTDVPCSGEGMFRKDKQAITEWSVEKVEKCQRLQREIVSDIWGNLRTGGILIYSTCTFNAKENEENVLWIAEELGAEFVEIPIPQEWNITGSLYQPSNLKSQTSNLPPLPVYRFIPGKTRGEGLFMAVLRKSGNESGELHDERQATWDKKRKKKEKSSLNVLSMDFLTDMREAEGSPQVELPYEQAINYLRREALTLPPDTPRDVIVVTYKGFPLGLAKNIGNRANNLYPKEWRIRKR